MPRKGAYVAQLTPTVVRRIQEVLDFMIHCEMPDERRRAAMSIRLLLTVPAARRSVRPKVKERP